MDLTPLYQGLFAVSTVASLALGYAYLVEESRKQGEKTVAPAEKVAVTVQPPPMLKVKVLYASQTGTAKGFADVLRKEAFAMNVSNFHIEITPEDIKTYDIDNIDKETMVIFLMPTWTGGVPPESAKIFFAHVYDMATDFRVSKAALSNLQYAIFGLGNKEYDHEFCRAATDLNDWLSTLGAEPICDVGLGDCNLDMEAQFFDWRQKLWPRLCEIYANQFGIADELSNAEGMGSCGSCNSQEPSTKVFRRQTTWEEGDKDFIVDSTMVTARNKRKQTRLNDSCCSDKGEACGCAGAEDKTAEAAGKDASWLPLKEYRRLKRQLAEESKLAARIASKDEDGISVAGTDIMTAEDLLNDKLLAEADLPGVAPYVDSDDETVGADKAGGVGKLNQEPLADIEDMGGIMASAAAEKAAPSKGGPLPEMATPAQRRALTKEGYKLIGTHSAVKLCRWTKAQLRGRGGCYKHTFYGIQSYQCMEATPSLACANKCVFCWRHHKNPVGREWRWQVDAPEMIVEEAVAKHCNMIKELRGMPGVKPERLQEAFNVRHCALSLVGEPIMYPHVNQLVKLLHERNISTFLVTNAQFPECIAKMEPVTQLYVSIDAATKETLKAIDRPLFKDFWERFLASLDALREKKQRTVYRLTLVKGHNMTELDAYVELIQRGKPDLIEIKGVTYCGDSPGSNLTMNDVPWHHEVKEFCALLASKLGDSYGLAAEHAHSCCVLLAKTDFRIDGVWHTHINYPRFHALVRRYYETGGAEAFTSLDYMAPTPNWATYDASEGGFDPIEMRFYRNKAGAVSEIEYKSSESGCG